MASLFWRKNIVTNVELDKSLWLKSFGSNSFKRIRLFEVQNKLTDRFPSSRARASPVFTTKRIKEIFAHFQKASQPFFSNIEAMIEAGKQDKVDIKDLLKGNHEIWSKVRKLESRPLIS